MAHVADDLAMPRGRLQQPFALHFHCAHLFNRLDKGVPNFGDGRATTTLLSHTDQIAPSRGEGPAASRRQRKRHLCQEFRRHAIMVGGILPACHGAELLFDAAEFASCPLQLVLQSPDLVDLRRVRATGALPGEADESQVDLLF